MRAFARQVWRNALLTVVLGVAVLASAAVLEVGQRNIALISGWTLFALILLLTIYNLRKRLTMLPVGRAKHWLQLHIYVGWLSVLLFGVHIGWAVPNGALEMGLATLYVLVALSGIFGIIITRIAPRHLTRGGEEVLLERIPGFAARLRDEAEQLVVSAARETGSSSLSDYFVEHLAGFFSGPKLHHLNVLAPLHLRFALHTGLDELSRYLAPKERDYLVRLRELVTKKDELDHQNALQIILRAWLFVHVPATYAMLLLAVVHLVTAHAFGGDFG